MMEPSFAITFRYAHVAQNFKEDIDAIADVGVDSPGLWGAIGSIMAQASSAKESLVVYHADRDGVLISTAAEAMHPLGIFIGRLVTGVVTPDDVELTTLEEADVALREVDAQYDE